MNFTRASLYASLLGISLFVACSHNHSDHEHEHEHEYEHAEHEESGEHHHHEDGVVEFDEHEAEAAGVVVDTVSLAPFGNVIATSGRLEAVSTDVNTISATVAGIVKMHLPLTPGYSVKGGATLFSISSANIQDGDYAARVKAEYEKAKADYQRVSTLYKEHLATQSDYEAAKAAYETILPSWQMMQKAGKGGVALAAPSSGIVLQTLVNDGSYVNVGDPLAIVSKGNRLQLVANLPESDYRSLSTITEATFRIGNDPTYYSTSDLGGRVVARGNASSSGARIPITFEFNNTANLPTGVFAEVYLRSPLEGERVISVPESAVLEEQGLYFVYVHLHGDHYRKTPVMLSSRDGGNIIVSSGLKEGDAVVVKGAMAIKLATSASVIPGHTHEH